MKAVDRWLFPLAANAVFILGILVSPLQASSLQTLERKLTVNGPVDLRVRTESEDLSVLRGGDGIVLIKCIVRMQNRDDDGRRLNVSPIEDSDLRIRRDGNRIYIDPIEDREKLRRRNVMYEVTVPANTRLIFNAASGDLTVDGIRGPVESRTASGDVRICAAQEDIRARTASGDVKLENIGGGAIDVDTGSGDVQLTMGTDAGYDLTAHTGSGDINVSGDISVEAGDIKNEVHGKVRGGGRPVNLRTGSGDVRVE